MQEVESVNKEEKEAKGQNVEELHCCFLTSASSHVLTDSKDACLKSSDVRTTDCLQLENLSENRVV